MPGDFFANTLYQFHRLSLGNMSVHAREHVVGYVLQGDVDVFAHVWLVLDDLEQAVGELIGVGIVQPYPLHALDVGHFANQIGYLALPIEVYTVISKLLGDDLKLFYALRNQAAHLFKNFFLGRLTCLPVISGMAQ